MPRIAREKSENGIYHVYAQGKQTKPLTKMIDDMEELCAILYVSKERFDFDLYAFCITKNEIHLVIKEKKEMEVSLIMKFILSVYPDQFTKRKLAAIFLALGAANRAEAAGIALQKQLLKF